MRYKGIDQIYDATPPITIAIRKFIFPNDTKNPAKGKNNSEPILVSIARAKAGYPIV